jgi:hypothetical protein
MATESSRRHYPQHPITVSLAAMATLPDSVGLITSADDPVLLESSGWIGTADTKRSEVPRFPCVVSIRSRSMRVRSLNPNHSIASDRSSWHHGPRRGHVRLLPRSAAVRRRYATGRHAQR